MKDFLNKGLTAQQAEASREANGDNVITEVKSVPAWKLFLDKFRDPMIRILIVAAVLSLIGGIFEKEFVESIGIFGAILLATGVSFWFEYDAQRRFRLLNTVNDDIPVKVIRDGAVVEIPRKEVVKGDIVILESGDEVPADGLLLNALGLSVDESSLTGEPSARKSPDPNDRDEEAVYPTDHLMRGSTVSEGNAVMEVIAVGDATEYGQLAREATTESGRLTPLGLQLEGLSTFLGKVGAGLGILIFAVLLVKGMITDPELAEGSWLQSFNIILRYFMVSVAVIVMAVPEGLPMSVTLSLALNMRRMLKSNNLVRKMHASETMGAVTVICTDKTGTLTRNRMSVSEIRKYTDRYDSYFDLAIAGNSTAFLNPEGKAVGNPTEGALLLWLREKGTDYNDLRNTTKVIDRISFATERKYMATLVESPDGRGNLLLIKGAPEIVLGMCRKPDDERAIKNDLSGFQNQAMRTLGFAVASTGAVTCEEAIAEAELIYTATAAVADPVRDDVPDAVRDCLDAGITVKIVTGDTIVTAREIARRIGLWDDSIDTDANWITGLDFEALSDEEALERVADIKIMARARPLDKQRMVKLLQKRGEVVAVTGDGTNDAPALNFADVGLAMGSGTTVAKQAGDITLIDDSFRSIASAVMWGRSLYKNIQRFIVFQLTVNVCALLVVFIGSVFGTTLPLTVTQILWVNIIMDTFAAMALASLPPEKSVMKEKPRKREQFIITPPMRKWIVGMGLVMAAALLGLLWWEGDDVYSLTIFFTVFVMMQLWNLFNARTFSAVSSGIKLNECKGFLLIVACIIIGQVIIVSIGGEVFRTVPLRYEDWMKVLFFTMPILIPGIISTWYKRRCIGPCR